jgi:hypothetical protein
MLDQGAGDAEDADDASDAAPAPPASWPQREDTRELEPVAEAEAPQQPQLRKVSGGFDWSS